MRKAAAALFGLALFAGQPEAQDSPSPQAHLTLEQGQVLAAHALDTGNPQLALQVSAALLQADRKNHAAWYLQAAAYAQAGQPGKGRKSAARAFRFAPDDAGRYQMAQLASRLAFLAGSPTLSQYWLRRTAVYAPDEKSEKLIAKDYQTLRRINPWSFRLRGEVKPSNNINNGADDTLQIVDGLPAFTGILGPRAVALSGTIGIADIGLQRRLRQSKRSLTTLGGRLYVQRAALSDSAKRKAAELIGNRDLTVPRNSEFGSTYGEISLRHQFSAGDPAKGGSASAGAALGTSWYGGIKTYNLARLSGSRSWPVSARSSVTLTAAAERRFSARNSLYQATALSLGAAVGRALDNGDTIKLFLNLRDTASDHVNTTYQAATLQAGYSFKKPLGPAKVTTSLILGHSDTPGYSLATFSQPVPLPGGRRDTSIYADVSLFFQDYGYAGFAPMLRLRGGKKRSNHSRFESSEFSVSLGFESKF